MNDNGIIDFDNLAYRTDIPLADARAAGRSLFEHLSGDDPDLTKALVAAATASGLEPHQVLQILAAIAEDFRRPVPDSQVHSLAERIFAVRGTAKEKLEQSAELVRANLKEIDLASIKESSTDKLRDIREKFSEVDISELGERAKEAGASLLDNARSLAKSVRDSVDVTKSEKQESDDRNG